MDEYEKQANEFLKKTNTKLKVEFREHRKYFPSDEDKRDVYAITMTRGEREFRFSFGQSLSNSGLILYNYDGNRTKHKGFNVPVELRQALREATTTNEKRRATLNLREWFRKEYFSLGRLTYKFVKPTAYDVLSCLQKYEVESFKDFCDEFGYDNDSIQALKIYEAVKREYDNLKMLYSEEELALLREIE